MAKLELLQADYKTLSRTVVLWTKTQRRFTLNASTFQTKRFDVSDKTLRRFINLSILQEKVAVLP